MSGHGYSRAGLLARIGGRLLRRPHEHSVRDSIAELVEEAAAEAATPGGAPELDRQERALIANVLRLRGTTADDVMVPRPDIVAIEVSATLDEAVALFQREGHSRLAVYREELDAVVGMVHIKDVFAFVGRAEAFKLEAILRKPMLVAPQIPVLDLLLQMRQAHMHLALVVDEFGTTSGLITIEDVLEEIVGEIEDEFDEQEQENGIYTLADGSHRVAGDVGITAVNEAFGTQLPEADFETIGGLLAHQLGRVPRRGEAVEVGGLRFVVMITRGGAVRWFRVSRAPSPVTTADGGDVD
jgi:magnesium and cobalt transporter